MRAGRQTLVYCFHQKRHVCGGAPIRRFYTYCTTPRQRAELAKIREHCCTDGESKPMAGEPTLTLAERVAALEAADELIAGSVDTFYYITVGALVFFMQAGFGLLEAGSVRTKNTKNILLKNLLDACIGAIVWWAWGFAAAVKLP